MKKSISVYIFIIVFIFYPKYIFAYHNQKANEKTNLEKPIILNESDTIINVNYFSLTWGMVPDADSYTLQYHDSGSWSDSISISIKATAGYTSYTIEDFNKESMYFIRIKAANAFAESQWSDTLKVRVIINNKPVFQDQPVYPEDNATDINKSLILRWNVVDTDGDELDFMVKLGTSSDALNIIRSFNKYGYIGQNYYDVNDEKLKNPIRPNTRYFWQIFVKETRRDLSYYGEWISSPVWCFTTNNIGPDPFIAKVEALTEIKPRSVVTFRVTVGNQGAEEIVNTQFIKTQYIKDKSESLFYYKGTGHIAENIEPGGTASLDINVQFEDDILFNNELAYDNVLIPGNSQVRFYFSPEDPYDINFSNNSYSLTITYNDLHAPDVKQFQIKDCLTYDYFNVENNGFFARPGNEISVTVKAEDDIKISYFAIEYQHNATDSWMKIYEQQNQSHYLSLTCDDKCSGNSYDWFIPENMEVTDDFQIRVRLLDTVGNESSLTTTSFPIVSNKLNAMIMINEDRFNIHDDLSYSLNIDSEHPIIDCRIDLHYDDNYIKVYHESNLSGLSLPKSYTWNISNEDYVSNNCYLKVEIKDLYCNQVQTSSKTFTILSDQSLPFPFNKKITILKDRKFPPNALIKQQDISTDFVQIDENNLTHAVVSHFYEYYIDTAEKYLEDLHHLSHKKYYMTYDSNKDIISTPIEICDDEYEIKDFAVISGIPYVLLKNGKGFDSYFWSHKNGADFSLPESLENEFVPIVKAGSKGDESDSLYKVNPYKFVYANGRIWELNFKNTIKYYDFFSGSISDMKNKIVNNQSETYESEYIKPALDGDYDIYFIDNQKDSLIHLNVEPTKPEVTMEAYTLPFSINHSQSISKKTSICSINNKIYIFGNGQVYTLEDEKIINKTDIQYTVDGQMVSYSENWDDVKELIAVKGEYTIFLLLSLKTNSHVKPIKSYYELLKFDHENNSFTKNVAALSTNNFIYDDYIHAGNDHLLFVKSRNLSSHPDIYNYSTSFSMLNLKTGAFHFLGSPEFPGIMSSILFEQQRTYYILGNIRVPDYKTVFYQINPEHLDIKLKQVKDIQFLPDNKGSLYATWHYGNPYDGSWNQQKQQLNNELHRKNMICAFNQTEQTVSEVKALSETYLGSGKCNLAGSTLSFSYSDKLFKLKPDLSVSQINIQFKKGQSPFTFKSYDPYHISASQTYQDNSSIIQIFRKNLSNKVVQADFVYKFISTFHKEALLVGFESSNMVITRQNLLNSKSVNIFLGKSEDCNSSRIDINQNKYIAIAWEKYLAVGDFSKVEDNQYYLREMISLLKVLTRLSEDIFYTNLDMNFDGKNDIKDILLLMQ
jgi:hypothetical protein